MDLNSRWTGFPLFTLFGSHCFWVQICGVLSFFTLLTLFFILTSLTLLPCQEFTVCLGLSHWRPSLRVFKSSFLGKCAHFANSYLSGPRNSEAKNHTVSAFLGSFLWSYQSILLPCMFNSVPLKLLQGSSSPGNFKLGVFSHVTRLGILCSLLCVPLVQVAVWAETVQTATASALGIGSSTFPWECPPTPGCQGLPGSTTGFQRTSLVVQWLRLHLPMQGVQVWFLSGSYIPHAWRVKKPKHKKTETYCSKFNKNFKNGLYQKIFNK